MLKLTKEQKEDLVDALINAISVGVFMFCLLTGVGSAIGVVYLIFNWQT